MNDLQTKINALVPEEKPGITAGELANKIFNIPASPQKENESTFKKLHAALLDMELIGSIRGTSPQFPPRRYIRIME